MDKQFYDHLISLDTFDVSLETIDASPEEKKHLRQLAKENLHVTILDVVLSELSPEDKKTFLKHMHGNNHEKVWELLKEKTTDLEQKISKAAKVLIDEFDNDIRELRKS